MGFRQRISLMLIGLGLLLTACEGLAGEPSIVATLPPQSVGDTTLAQEDIAAVMTLGGEVWMGNCAECHGQNGLGTADGAPLPDLTSFTDEQILASINGGKGDEMPAFADVLNADELTAAMTYAKMMSLARSRGMLATAEPDSTGSSVLAEATQAVPDEDVVLGIVTGQVTNGTSGAALPAALPVTLHVVKSEFVEEALESTVDSEGIFRFENVPFDGAYQYVVTAAYGDVMFVSELVTVEPGQTELTQPITLYESGAPQSAIRISAISAQLMVQDGMMQVIEIVSFVNTSDQVYFRVDEEGATSVRLYLPQNASLMSSVSSRYLLSEDGRQIYSTRPVMPGESHLMHIAYSMPYDQSVTVDQMLDYPLDGRVEIVLATTGLSLTGEGFGDPQQGTLGDFPVTSYSGQMTRAAETSLHYEVSGVPAPAQTAGSAAAVVVTSPLAYVLIGAGISAFVIAAILTLRERSRAKPASSSATIGELLEQIANLDSQHAQGKLNAEKYEHKRTALKAQLSALMKTQ